MGKVQFTSDDETSAWFGKTAREEGVSQPALFAQMRSAFETRQTIQGHPAHGASLEALEGLIGGARDLFRGLVVACDTADERAAKRVEKQLAELERQLAGEKAWHEAAVRALEKSQNEVDRLTRERDEAVKRADDLAGARERERAALQEAREARTALEETRAAASAAEARAAEAATSLAIREAELARADAEIRRLTQASGTGAENGKA